MWFLMDKLNFLRMQLAYMGKKRTLNESLEKQNESIIIQMAICKENRENWFKEFITP